MLVHIRNIEKDISGVANTEEKDYKLLAKNLQHHMDLLTSNCTMKGQAHDELHKWLLPYIDLVNVFSETTNKQELVVKFKQIQASFLTFNQYFQ
jgi:pyridoxal biosynthesis lyase PdxS